MSKPRILGGTARGRLLETPSRGTRPSPSRLREALFNILQNRDQGSFLDLFSGSGAVGLEAASRGWQTTCVDNSAAAVAVIRRNAVALGLATMLVQQDALSFLETSESRYDVIFAAPPYPLDLNAIFRAILRFGKLPPGGLFVLQHPSGYAIDLNLQGDDAAVRFRRYGSNAITLVEPRQNPTQA